MKEVSSYIELYQISLVHSKDYIKANGQPF